MKYTFLFLRPFDVPSGTAKQLGQLCRAIRSIGRLTAIQNREEDTILRSDGGRGDQVHNSMLSKLSNFLHPPTDGVILIHCSSQTWRRIVIEQIGRADAVIVNLAPRNKTILANLPGIKHDLPPKQLPSEVIEDHPIHETGTGQGLLQELDYCKQANALHKTIALIPAGFYPRVIESVKALAMGNLFPGRWLLKDTGSGLVQAIPRFSELDYSLLHLKEAHSVIRYRRFGGPMFNVQVRRALWSCVEPKQKARASTPDLPSEIYVGIPSEPIPLPPDGKLKRVRFTPVESLTKPPRHEVVEVSFDEVKKMHPGRAEKHFRCQSCGRGAESIFFFQFGLEPDLSTGAMIYMKCQYCGYYENSAV